MSVYENFRDPQSAYGPALIPEILFSSVLLMTFELSHDGYQLPRDMRNLASYGFVGSYCVAPRSSGI